MNTSAASYKKAAILSASPERLILMLYDGALDAMKRAKEGFKIDDQRQRNETISNNLIRAQNIFAELQRALKLEGKADFAQHMYGLYDFYTTKLNEANFKKEEGPIDVVLKLFKEIRDAWAEMLTKTDIKVRPTANPYAHRGGTGISLRA